MTGPDINRPRPGSNAIGSFTIGVSPIGTIPDFDYWSTVISQYANSPILTQLIANFFQYVDQTANIDNFFDLIWNVDTAQGYGLAVWGNIVGVSNILQVATPGDYFDFSQAGSFGVNSLGSAPFYVGAPLTNNFVLADDAYRVLIFAKALSNISNGSIQSINQLLRNLFPNRGNCYVTDGLNMTMTYSFVFVLSPVEVAILEQSGVLPKPAGVSATVVQVP